MMASGEFENLMDEISRGVQMQVLGPMVTEMEILLETRDCGEKLMTRPEPPFLALVSWDGLFRQICAEICRSRSVCSSNEISFGAFLHSFPHSGSSTSTMIGRSVRAEE